MYIKHYILCGLYRQLQGSPTWETPGRWGTIKIDVSRVTETITWLYQHQVIIGFKDSLLCYNNNKQPKVNFWFKKTLYKPTLPVMSCMVSSSDALCIQFAWISSLQNSDCNQTCDNQDCFSVPLVSGIEQMIHVTLTAKCSKFNWHII